MTTSTEVTGLRPGDLISVEEGDYLRGAGPFEYVDGPLLLRVTRVPRPSPLALSHEWVAVRGVEIRPDGSRVGDQAYVVRRSRR